ncbi:MULTISPECIES: hypothetical protein [unclassified Mesorhizobium]|uniref:hypothetical protein n=1 Tax=unclassified Mesorhizobium TaxID=325217 RepID=UPI000FCC5B96|nr:MULTISPECIES: hypothetical protein [unclassified Mesorhizobium]RUT88120.1 hypothetical protein EOD14_07910 [Mesorhizobium sp. M7A.T.Ca.US.000.02.1.1]RUT91873.1 hypothetical protein EOD15_12915 [Mesorhizobium sp. M7A.T.Ca.US.000.02.2.1]RUU01000.1 hypothetical protein EOD12_17420 [Mesorhizobium sp. M7A.T.Ca.TU.009.02.1.1]
MSQVAADLIVRFGRRRTAQQLPPWAAPAISLPTKIVKRALPREGLCCHLRPSENGGYLAMGTGGKSVRFLFGGTIGSGILAYLSFKGLWHAALFAFLYAMLYMSIEEGFVSAVQKLSTKPPAVN